MPIYSYRCDSCGELTDQFASVDQRPERVTCASCGSAETRRIISPVSYHASNASKTARLDPKYEKMVDDSMRKSASADEQRLIRKLKPFNDGKS